MVLRCAIPLGLLICSLAVVRADDWPQFRGPNGSAVSDDKELPAEWGAKRTSPGRPSYPATAGRRPIVWGDKVFVTTASSDKQTQAVRRLRRRRSAGRRRRWLRSATAGRRTPSTNGRSIASMPPTARCCGSRPPPSTSRPSPSILQHLRHGNARHRRRARLRLLRHDRRLLLRLRGKQVWKADLGSYQHGAWATAPAARRRWTATACSSSATTRRSRSWWPSTRRPARNCGGRTGPRTAGWSTPLVWKNKERTEIVCLGSPRGAVLRPGHGQAVVGAERHERPGQGLAGGQ